MTVTDATNSALLLWQTEPVYLEQKNILNVRLLITQIVESFTAPNFVLSSGRIKFVLEGSKGEERRQSP